MTLFGIRRPTDRASAHQRKEAKSGPGRRLPDKPDKSQGPALCGWNLPIIPDDSDIIVWMKREKNGDNKRKKINEVYEEEQYRHITGHCAAIENKLLFDRQSLNDRYLKNCQFGVRNARANKVAPVGPLPVTRAVTRPPSQQDVDRNCFSANALEGDPVDEEEEEENVGVLRGLSRGRSQSAVCRSASMRAHGMTLPDSRPTCPVAGDSVKDEGEDAGWDEGYGSKVSSNDQDGAEEADSTKTLDDCSGGAGGDSGVSAATLNKVGPVLNPFQAQPLSHQDAMAKLMYSRRERTVYERLPSRRMRGNSFRYAGREQSRLMEASLSHINPAYLARYHHLADLASTAAQAKHTHSGSEQCPPPPQVVVVENGDGGEMGGSGKGLQPRTMVLRKITIQDSGKELFSQHIHSCPGSTAGGVSATGGQSPEKAYQRQGLVSPTSRTPSERAVSETQSHIPRSGVSGSDQVSVRVQDLTPDLTSTRNSPSTMVTSLSVPSSSQAKSVMSMLSVPSARTMRDDRQAGSSPLMSPASRTSPAASDRLSAMSSFAVTDLLPAVERNLRSQRTSQRGLSKSKTMGVTTSFSSSISNQQQQRQQKQQHQTRGRQPQRNHQAAMVPKAQSNGEVAGLRSGAVEGSTAAGREDGSRPPSIANGMTGTAVKKSSAAEDVRSFPGFRPHYQTTPLQRAKEIANRRMHGHVTQMPDGSETVRVPSPLYASRTDQQTSHRRAKSASRLLGQVMSRYTFVKRNSAV